ncbi:MAG: hypothetical protein HZB53_10225 [Chloroflexi bacterium]|nr:hypothetical protein [Chloroflexota bacterium]
MDPLLLRPLTVGDVLDLSVLVFRRNVSTMFSIGALVTIPMFLIPLCAVFSVGGIAALSTSASTSMRGALAAASGVGAVFAVVVFAMLVTWIQAGAAAFATARALAGEKPRTGAAYRAALAHGLHILIAAMLLLVADAAVGAVGIVPCIGFLISLPLASIVHALFGFVWPVIVLENLDGVEALQRSYHLARGALPRVWLTMLGAGILSAAAWLGPFALALSLLGLFPPLIGGILLIIIGAMASCLSAPFAHTVTTVMYYDLRMRQEGYDLYLRAGQIRPEAANP